MAADNKSGCVLISRVVPGSPAYLSRDVEVGDVLLEVDGKQILPGRTGRSLISLPAIVDM
eukprot:712169-Hanusia_phi.AAC.2